MLVLTLQERGEIIIDIVYYFGLTAATYNVVPSSRASLAPGLSKAQNSTRSRAPPGP
jgi:hypothetical protein